MACSSSLASQPFLSRHATLLGGEERCMTSQKRQRGRLHVLWAHYISITDSFFHSLYAFQPCRKFFLKFLVLTTAEGLQGHRTHSHVNFSACYWRDICKGKIIPWISSSRVNEQACSAVVNAVVFHQSKWLVLSHMIPNFVIFSAREDNRQWNTRWAFAQTYIFTCEKIAVAMATSQILIPIYLIQKRLLLRLVIDNWALSIWARELNAMINLVPTSHSVLHWKVRSPFPLAVGDLGTRLCNDLLEWPLNNSFQVHNSQCPKQSSLNQLLN